MKTRGGEQGRRRPRLRFPEFENTGGWERAQLDKLIATITPPKKIPTNEYLSTGKFPIIDQGQNSIAGWTDDQSALNMISESTIIFGDHTCALKLVSTPFAQGADGIKIFKGNDLISTEYLHQFLSFNPVTSEEYKRHFSILKLKQIDYPRRESGEQIRIADCLSSLDSLMAAQTQKLDALRSHKRGLMQQLFPAEGESTPRLRFPEFENKGEWETRELGKLAEFASGGTPSKDVPEYWGGNIPWISASSMYETKLNKSELNVTEIAIKNGTCIAKKGTLLVLVRGSMLFNRVPMGIADMDVAFNQDVKALSVGDGVTVDFLLHELISYESRIPILSTGIGAGKIETEDLKRFAIFIPSLPEQTRIADCLSSLDALIAAHSDKIAELKTFKRGLMQQLFPVPDEGEE